jgi:hypothetical protein
LVAIRQGDSPNTGFHPSLLTFRLLISAFEFKANGFHFLLAISSVILPQNEIQKTCPQFSLEKAMIDGAHPAIAERDGISRSHPKIRYRWRDGSDVLR